MAHHKGCIVGVTPGADLDKRELEGLKGPLNGLAEQQIGIQRRVTGPVTDHGLHLSVKQNVPLAVTVYSQQRPHNAVCKYGCATCCHPKGKVHLMGGVPG